MRRHPIRALDYGYDAADRQVRVVDEGQVVLSKQYANRSLSRIQYGNGLERRFSYRGPVLIASSTVRGDLEIEHSEIEYTLCLAGLALCHRATTTTAGAQPVTTVESSVMAPVQGAGWSEAGPRVVSWSPNADFSSLGSNGHVYEYDALGNMTRREGPAPGGPSAFEFNAEHNRLEAGAGHHYRYDAAGFTIERDGVPLGWQANGRIASIGETSSFRWDSEGRPIEASSLGRGTTRFLFGGRVRGDAKGRPLSLSIANEVVIDLESSRRRYRHFDFRGNVTFVSDEFGEVVTHLHYSAYRAEDVRGAEPAELGFAQGVVLEDSDLMMLGARVYDPDVGRFLSPDPAHQLINQYSYTLGNPLWFWDPDGREAQPAGGVSTGDLVAAGGIFVLGGVGIVGVAPVVGFSLIGIGLGIVVIALIIGYATSGGEVSAIGALQGGGLGGGLGGCAPDAIAALPNPGWALAVLIPLQLILGTAVLLRRRRVPRSDEASQ